MEVIRIEKNKKKDILSKNGKKRVVAYVRVSTEYERANLSYENQMKYYEEKISDNPNWEYKGIYSDKGITGSSTINRKGFLKMLVDADNDKFDLVLTKSISRFARNTLDTIKYVRFLKERNIGVFFEEENIYTLDMQSELVLSILGSVAQQEIETLSSSVTYGQQQRMKDGFIVGFGRCYGYDCDVASQTYTINKEEAKVVRLIFDLYLQGNGVDKIRKILFEKNLVTRCGNKSWGSSAIYGILKNEKYYGDYVMVRRCVVNSLENKKVVKNKGHKNQYVIKNHHEPIISKEEFDEVQKIMLSRQATSYSGKWRNRYCFSRRVRCGFCLSSMNRMCKRKNSPYYRCSLKRYNLDIECNYSRAIREEILKKVWVEAINKFRSSKKKIDNNLAREKVKHLNRLLAFNKINKFDDELFSKLVHCVVFGEQDGDKIIPYSIKFIIKSNSIINTFPTKEELQSHNYYEIFSYMSKISTRYKDSKTNTIHNVDSIKVTFVLDLTGDI